MPLPYVGKMQDTAVEKYGEPLDVVIPRLMFEQGLKLREVAIQLEVADNAVRNWLLKNGYAVVDGVWRKQAASRD